MYTLDGGSDNVRLPRADNEGMSSDDESLSEHWTGLDIPPWKAALASKAVLTVHDVNPKSSKQAVQWTFPHTRHQQQRHAVFADLYFKRC